MQVNCWNTITKVLNILYRYGGEDMKMEEMIEICIPYSVKAGKYKDIDAARAGMMAFFPKLKRWAK